MARRRRAVERVNRRQGIADRVVIVVLVVVAASGLMSVLPGRSQAAVSRLACQVGSLGLGACGNADVDLGDPTLNAPRCAVLADLDAVVPEVRVNELTTSQGLGVRIASSRAGDTYLQLGDAGEGALPEPLAGQVRGTREVLPGASVPVRAEWYLPSIQGAQAVVDATQDEHRRWVQQRSSMAVLSALGGRGGRDIPAPTLLYSAVRLSSPTLPTFPADASPTDPPTGSYLQLDRDRVATLAFNRVTRESAVVASARGTLSAAPVTGTVRWTRNAAGDVTSVVVAVVSDRALVKGEQPPAGSVGVAYVSVPVGSGAEQALVQAWLSDASGFRVGLDQLLGLQAAEADDQLGSFLTRAATVTVLRYADVDVTTADDRVREELTSLQRTEWTSTAGPARLVAAGAVAAQPTRTPRRLVDDPSCRTP